MRVKLGLPTLRLAAKSPNNHPVSADHADPGGWWVLLTMLVVNPASPQRMTPAAPRAALSPMVEMRSICVGRRWSLGGCGG